MQTHVLKLMININAVGKQTLSSPTTLSESLQALDAWTSLVACGISNTYDRLRQQSFPSRIALPAFSRRFWQEILSVKQPSINRSTLYRIHALTENRQVTRCNDHARNEICRDSDD